MVRVAVVGAGAWGMNHVRAMSRAKDADLVMVCDSSEGARARAATLAPRARLGHGFEEALAAADVDAVVLATPAKDHAEQARALLAAGKHVLVEKPLALTAADAEAVVATAEAKARVLMVGHLMLFHPAVERLKAMIEEESSGASTTSMPCALTWAACARMKTPCGAWLLTTSR